MNSGYSEAYDWICEHYDGKSAARSGRKYILHIDDGLNILNSIHASDYAKAAYCLHPMFQDDSAIVTTMSDSRMTSINQTVLMYVMEYRNKANSYLCAPLYNNENCPEVMVFPFPAVRHMLIADKVQNQNDFIEFHLGIHPHWRALKKYFTNWMVLLEHQEGIIQ